jgi:hypothetical protein
LDFTHAQPSECHNPTPSINIFTAAHFVVDKLARWRHVGVMNTPTSNNGQIMAHPLMNRCSVTLVNDWSHELTISEQWDEAVAVGGFYVRIESGDKTAWQLTSRQEAYDLINLLCAMADHVWPVRVISKPEGINTSSDFVYRVTEPQKLTIRKPKKPNPCHTKSPS